MAALSQALPLAEEYGLPVFPCRPWEEVIAGKKFGAKSPLTPHGFEDASTNLDQIERWFTATPDALIGVPTGTTSKLFVIDIDPTGQDWYQEHAAELACGRIHKTRRGWHLIYRMPKEPLTNSTGALPDGVDARGVGGYIIWWPAQGLEAVGSLEDLTLPPKWLIELLKKPRPAAQANGNGKHKYGEGERHKALLKFASSLRHKGVTGRPMEAALLAWNLENCSPPQDEDDVRRIAKDYIEKPEDADVARTLQDLREFSAPSFRSLAAKKIEPKVPLVRDLLFPGAWLVVGRPKIGKSWLILQLALAVAENTSFLGFSCDVANAEVLCIFGEDDDARIQSRLSALGVASPPDSCYVINRDALRELAKRFAPTLTFLEFLEFYLAEHPQLRMLVIDTETTLRQVWGGEREAPTSANRVVETDYKQTSGFDEIALRHRIVILLVNHAAKRKGEWVDPHETINRSNTAFAGASGSLSMVDPPDADPFDPKARLRILAIRGRDLKDDSLLAIHQDEAMPYFISDGPYDEVRQTQAEAEVLSAVEELMPEVKTGKYVSSEDIASALSKNRGAIKRTISRMVQKGKTRWKDSRLSVKRGKEGGVRLDPLSEP